VQQCTLNTHTTYVCLCPRPARQAVHNPVSYRTILIYLRARRIYCVNVFVGSLKVLFYPTSIKYLRLSNFLMRINVIFFYVYTYLHICLYNVYIILLSLRNIYEYIMISYVIFIYTYICLIVSLFYVNQERIVNCGAL